MIRITTSEGKTYDAAYAWAPLLDGSCGISLQDERPLWKIAKEFDGLSGIHCVDTEAGLEYDFDGYTKLTKVERNGDNVTLRLEKGE